MEGGGIGEGSVVIAEKLSAPHTQKSAHLMRIILVGIKMNQSVKSHNIRDMTKEMEQAEMRLKAFMPRTVTLPLSLMSSAADGSASGPSEPKKRRGSTPWIKHSIKRQKM